MNKTFVIPDRELTKDEVVELFSQMNPHVIFQSYYKYDFSFVGVKEEWFNLTEEEQKEVNYKSKRLTFKFSTRYGGNKDDIYRYSVSMDEPKPLLPLAEWNQVTIEVSGSETGYEWRKIADFDLEWG